MQKDFLPSQLTTALDELVPAHRVRVRNPDPPPVSAGTRRAVAGRPTAADRARYQELSLLARSAMLRDPRDSFKRRIAVREMFAEIGARTAAAVAVKMPAAGSPAAGGVGRVRCLTLADGRC